MKFEGIIPPVITPFNDDFSVDEAGYATMIEYMIDKGVHAHHRRRGPPASTTR